MVVQQFFNMLKHAVNWLSRLFIRSVKAVKDTVSGKNKQRPVFWDSGKRGTYQRKYAKIGRNTPCPCGKKRQYPRDTNKVEKYKRCCGKDK